MFQRWLMITNLKGQGHSFEPPRWASSGLRLRVASETQRRALAQRRSTFCFVFSLFSFPFQCFSDFYAHFFFTLDVRETRCIDPLCLIHVGKMTIKSTWTAERSHCSSIYIKEAKLQWLVGSEQDFSWTTQPSGWPLNQLSGLHILCDSECLGVPQEELQSFASLKHPAEPMLPADPLVHGRRLEFILVIINISNITGWTIMLILHLIFYFSPLFQTVGREREYMLQSSLRGPAALDWCCGIRYSAALSDKKKNQQNRTKIKWTNINL